MHTRNDFLCGQAIATLKEKKHEPYERKVTTLSH